MSLKVKNIIEYMESIAPSSYAMEWDRVGLQVGSPKKTVQRIMITLEVNLGVLKEAADKGVDLIISHHPLIFKPLEKIDFENSKGAMIQKMIQEDLHLYISHTNMDAAPEGLNHYIAEKIGLNNIATLSSFESKPYCKFIVYVPETYKDEIIEAIHQGGGGYIGNYSHCTFGTQGIGTFKPKEGASPFLGKENELEKVKETKIETIVQRKDFPNLLEIVKKAHPYEEVAYDLYPMEIPMENVGLGRIGDLSDGVKVKSFIQHLKKTLQLNEVRYVGDLQHEVSRIAILNGSGGDFIKTAKNAGAECFVTGDLKYHEAQDAMDAGMTIIDIGHYESEIIFRELIKSKLQTHFGQGLEIFLAESLKNPFHTL